ncbi:histidine phosphatase family protein [Virgibacillus siamensis]|uniref:histidine phosphatase family protein n=1 Tax=Virgibacillus siamensis TaxID=480071 RepID=UPI0009849519|nr:histidine phosphatase family protein [Virgibacillus siamensis]
MIKLGFVRHGITPWNIEGRAQGSSDIPLAEQGLQEARLLAVRPEIRNWDIVYSSDLLRAKQTAEIIVDKIEVPLHLDPRLRERGGGLIEGTTEEERVKKWGPNWRELDMGFETNENIISRGMSFIEEISDKHVDKRVLVVSHGAFIKRLLNALMPDSDMDESLKNTSLTSLTRSMNVWNCSLYNCTAHLAKHDSLKL